VLPAAAANGCDSTIQVVLTFLPEPTTLLSDTRCPGDTILVNGTPYHAGHPVGTETIPAGSYLGCDSVVVVDLSFLAPAVLDFQQTLCVGGSVVLAGTTYDETNPSDTVILEGAGTFGCDSFIYVQLTFNEVVQTLLADTLCPGGSVTVGGTVYDGTLPAGTEVFPGGSYLGCDSVVNVALTFLSPAFSMLTDTLCAGSTMVVNGTLYDAGHPSGIETITGAAYLGCDSVVQVDLHFLPLAVDTLLPVLCAGASVTIDGVVFDEGQPFGTIPYPGGGYLGCDSALFVQLAFHPTASGVWTDTLCPGGTFVLNGQVFDEDQPSGTVVLSQAAWTGCDSVVQVELTFGDEVTAAFAPTLCPGEVVFINGTLYFAGNPTGTETFPGGSYLGCDSTVLVSLSYHPDAVGTVSATLPPDGSVLVNGTLYDRFNPSGTEILPGASANGCDSVVLVDLTFLQTLEPDVSIVPPNCKGGADGQVRVEAVTGGVPPYTVTLTGYPSLTIFEFPAVFEDLPTGFYYLLVKDADGNSYGAELLLPDPPPLVLDAGPDQVLLLGAGTILSPTAGFEVESWNWSPPDFLSCTDCERPSVLSPAGEITYTLTVLTAAGCSATDELVLTVQPLRRVFVPNAFSPDGDGINDRLSVFPGSGVRVVRRFQVYNRWGEQLYAEEALDLGDAGSGWDGRHRGEDMPAGVYVWVAEVEFVDRVALVLKGEVNLLR
jgi:gliding motility-associated-like protein